MSNYSNLPGVNIDVKDGQMLITQDNTTNSMLIIGEVKAPSNIEVPEDAVLVRNEQDLFDNFGRYMFQGEVNPIAAEWFVAREGGVQNVYLLGLKGDNEKERFVNLQEMLYEIIADYQFSQIVVAGMYADEDIEGLTANDFGVNDLSEVSGLDAYFTVRGTTDASGLTVTDPETLTVVIDGQEAAATFDSNVADAVDVAQSLTDQIRMSLSEQGVQDEFFVQIEDGKAVIRSVKDFTVEGEAILNALGISQPTTELEGVGNIARLLGDFAERQTMESEAVIVYVPTRPPLTTNKREIKEVVDRLVARNNDISRHVQVVAGPQVSVSLPGSVRPQWLTGVTQYAVLVNSLAVQNAPTNQPLPGVNALRYDLSLRQLDALTGNKYVTFRSKNNRIVVVDGVTTAPDIYAGQDIVRSDFTRLSTLRATNYIVNAVRDVVDPFIGRPNEFPTYNAMNSEIKDVISRSIDRGVIRDAAYSIELGDDLNATAINMTILPQFELREINISIGLTTPSGFEALNQ